MVFSMMFSSGLTRDCSKTFGMNLWTLFLSLGILSFVKVVQKPCHMYLIQFWNSLY